MGRYNGAITGAKRMKSRPSYWIQGLSIFSMWVAGWAGIILEDNKYFQVGVVFLGIFIVAALWHRNVVDD